MNNCPLVIISGRSGSGKSTALHLLEDEGFYCIDNLPIKFISELDDKIGSVHHNIAISIDSRNQTEDLHSFRETLHSLQENGKSGEIYYLDADVNTLLRRYNETRRKHPLTSDTTSLKEAIEQEHTLLSPLADLADATIDTSQMSHHDLHQWIRDKVTHKTTGSLQLLIQSFGFKKGIPNDTDYIFDVRCLPNPYWQPGLRALSGKDQSVIRFLESEALAKELYDDIYRFLKNWLPKFQANNRCYMSIGIGCTGGRHRSVYLVDKLAKQLEETIDNILVRHRELPS